MKSLTLPKSARLLKNGQFRTVLSRKIAASDALLLLFVAKNKCEHPRLGISISRSAGNAVQRNRMKRLIREAWRLNQKQIPQGRDYLVMLSPHFLRRVRASKKTASRPGRNSPQPVDSPAAIKNLKLKDVEKSFLSLTRELDSTGRLR